MSSHRVEAYFNDEEYKAIKKASEKSNLNIDLWVSVSAVIKAKQELEDK